MSDQQLPASGGPVSDEEANQKLQELKTVLRSLFQQTGLSTDAFQTRYGYSDGQLSKWQNQTPEPNIPPLRFVLSLLQECEAQALLQPQAGEAVLRQYGEVLEAWSRKARPHSQHVRMYAEYRLHRAVARADELTAELGAVTQRLAHAEADLEAAQRALDGERARQKQAEVDELRAVQARTHAERSQAVAERDELQHYLAQPVSASVPVPVGEGAGEHAHQRYASPVHGYPQQPPPLDPRPEPGGRKNGRAGARFTLISILVAVVVIVLGAFWITQQTGSKDSAAPDHKQSAVSTPAPTPTTPTPTSPGPQTSETSPSPSGSTGTPTGSPAITQDVTSYKFNPVLVDHDGLDIDSEPPVKEGDYPDLRTQNSQGQRVNISRTLTERKVVRLPAGTAATLDNCRHAMDEDFGDQSLPAGKGNGFCLNTSQQRIAYVKITETLPSTDPERGRIRITGTVWTDPQTLNTN